MSPTSLAMVLTAALLHAGWNLILKKVDEKYIVNWWSVLSSTLLLSPVIFIEGLPDRRVWPILLTSALVEAVYMVVLASAYRLNDFSLVYPIARGTAPAFITLWATLFLGERISAIGAAGLVLIMLGLMINGAGGLLERRRSGQTDSVRLRRTPEIGLRAGSTLVGICLALITALLISIYSTLDAAAVRHTPATSYTVTMLAFAGLFFTPFALIGSGWQKTVAVGRRYRREILAIGVAGMLAYILVVNAYAIAKVSYAGALREVSVVFGALAGWKLLGESFGKLRVIAALLLFCGVILIVLS